MRALFVLSLSAASLFAQAPAITSVVNSGSLDSRFCPGVVATINGSNLGTNLSSGTTVSVGGIPGLITALSPTQLNVAIPFNIFQGPADVFVTVPGRGMSNVVSITLTDSAPAFLTQPGTPALALFFHADNTLVTATSPARRGETVSGEFVGLGKLNREPPAGVTPSAPDYNTLYPPTFTLGGETATVVRALLVPGLVAVYRVDVQIPNDASPGPQIAALTINGSTSNTATIPVAGPPAVQIETPAPGSVISGSVTVSGWALDNLQSIGAAISTVQVQVDGVTIGTASYGIPRYDICAIYTGRPRCPNIGFTYQLDTQMLSPGNHTITVVATTAETVPNSGSASTIVSVGSTPAVFIDSPAAGSTVSGIVTVTGWAVDTTSTSGTSTIAGVQMVLDGLPQGSANYGVSRPEACTNLPGRPGCPYVGFMYQLDTRPLSVGPHILNAVAFDASGKSLPGPWSVNLTVGPAPSVTIDSPSAGANVSGTITISGWAIDSTTTIGTAINSVDVRVDGTRVGAATYGISRTDVCAAYPGRVGCPNVGFNYSLNTSTLAGGAHTITVSATDSDGTPDSGSSSVTVNVISNLKLTLDTPAGGSVISGSVTMAGWALAPAGASIATINVLVDGTLNGTATYGISRTDVCGFYPGYAACPNVGFNYTLNTAGLAPGPHLITVTAIDNESTPQSTSTSAMINVSSNISTFIDSPAPGATVTGVVNVTGWAIPITGGGPIILVEIFVDDAFKGIANYGLSRPDACTSNPGQSGCPNVGFLYPLDTTSLSPGTHVIKVVSIDNLGPPNMLSWSTSVVK